VLLPGFRVARKAIRKFLPTKYKLRRQILASMSNSELRRALLELTGAISPKEAFHVEGDTLRLEHDHGFFSNCSIALLGIARAGIPIKRIDASESFSLYTAPNNDSRWETFFKVPAPSAESIDTSFFSSHLWHHEDYRRIDFHTASLILGKYFRPADEVLEKVGLLMKKYDVVPANTFAINYRGTDKRAVVRTPSFATWKRRTDSILESLPGNNRILIQTDQLQFLDFFKRRYGNRIFYFDELPLSRGDVGLHKTKKYLRKESMGQTFLAAVLIISKCETVLTHTGNIGFWTALFRGNTSNFTQL